MSGTCTSCTTKTLPCWAPGNTCAAEFTSVLSKLGAPAPGANNLNMLLAWSHGECGPGNAACNPFAGYNPLATTWESATPGGCWSCNAGGCFVRCYATLDDGATAIADTLQNGAYPTIVAALRGDWTQCQWQCSAAIRAELGSGAPVPAGSARVPAPVGPCPRHRRRATGPTSACSRWPACWSAACSGRTASGSSPRCRVTATCGGVGFIERKRGRLAGVSPLVASA